MKLSKVLLLIVIISIPVVFYFSGIDREVVFRFVNENVNSLVRIYGEHPFVFIIAYGLIVFLSVTFSLPITVAFMIIAGMLFGSLKGILCVSISATLGATAAFFISRYILHDYFQKKFSNQFSVIDTGIRRSGLFYILFLRLVPIFPYTVINYLLGLTKVSVPVYIIGTYCGMTPGAFIMVYAGDKISKITTIADLYTPDILAALVLLGIFAFLPLVVARFKK
ncbi:TVP38/TMEM64 family protein [Candidatus Margulisiibacteriota bacterium]